MKVLVSTNKTQGRRKNDFCHVPDGEYVILGHMCDREEIDGPCGCARSMVGVKCRKATTTILVIDRDIEEEAYFKIIAESHNAAYGGKKPKLSDEDMRYGRSQGKQLLQIANAFELGDVLEVRGDDIVLRKGVEE
jgi:hypothetical protein